jgi:glycerol kinase
VSLDVRTGPDGSVEVDPEDLRSSVVEAGRQALATARVEVDAVGLANQGETVLAWDATTARGAAAEATLAV